MFDLLIVGGGFTGACLAWGVANSASKPLRLAIVEPREILGEGYAYQSQDPEHRLNAPAVSHSIDADDAEHLERWCNSSGLLERDPGAVTYKGLIIRRADFARYLDEQVRSIAHERPGVAFTHIRDSVSRIDVPDAPGAPSTIHLQDGAAPIQARVVALATGSPPTREPRFLQAAHDHPALISSPWDLERLRQIDPESSVVVIGVSLTAVDILAGLLARGHRGPLVAFSRRGLLPRPLPEPDPDAEPLVGNALARRLSAEPPPWLASVIARPFTVRQLTRALRQRIAETTAAGEQWQLAFDELRNAVWRFWPQLPAQEKHRYLRQLRPWYDVHRFRMAPQAARALADAQGRGHLRILRGRLQAVTAAPSNPNQLCLTLAGPGLAPADQRLVADAVVNCTGFDMGADIPADSMPGRLLAQGRLSRHASGLGFDVDDQGRALSDSGVVQSNLRLYGPPTVGHWGDPLGAIFISLQIRRQLPDLLATLSG